MTLMELASLFEERKSWLVTASDLSKDALHIYFGLALFMLVRLAWRWRGGWVAAWLAVLVMACSGEFLDMAAEFGNASIQPDAAHWHDIWNTMFWPTVLLVAGQWLQPKLERPGAASGENAERRLEQA